MWCSFESSFFFLPAPIGLIFSCRRPSCIGGGGRRILLTEESKKLFFVGPSYLKCLENSSKCKFLPPSFFALKIIWKRHLDFEKLISASSSYFFLIFPKIAQILISAWNFAWALKKFLKCLQKWSNPKIWKFDSQSEISLELLEKWFWAVSIKSPTPPLLESSKRGPVLKISNFSFRWKISFEFWKT